MIRQRVRAGPKTIKAAIARDGKFTSKAGVVRRRLGRPGAEPRKIERARVEMIRDVGIAKDRPAHRPWHRHRPQAQAGNGSSDSISRLSDGAQVRPVRLQLLLVDPRVLAKLNFS